MSRFSKHMGEDNFVEVDGERFDLKPLNTESIDDYLTVAKAFSGTDTENVSTEDIMAKFNAQTNTAIKNLVENTLQKSFPTEWKDDCEELKSFGMKYLLILLPKILEINSSAPENIESSKKEQIMARLNKNVKPVNNS